MPCRFRGRVQRNVALERAITLQGRREAQLLEPYGNVWCHPARGIGLRLQAQMELGNLRERPRQRPAQAGR